MKQDFPHGREAYLAEAAKLRRAPVLVRDRGAINGLATLVNHGKPVRRTWREITNELEDRGIGVMGPGALAKALKTNRPGYVEPKTWSKKPPTEPGCYWAYGRELVVLRVRWYGEDGLYVQSDEEGMDSPISFYEGWLWWPESIRAPAPPKDKP